MPRTARVAPGGMVFHVLNRGVGRMRLFGEDRDFETVEEIIEKTLQSCPMRICSYLLMSNHWHFVLWPEKNDELATFMQKLSVTHVRDWQQNRRRVGRGHVYQGATSPFRSRRTTISIRSCVTLNATRYEPIWWQPPMRGGGRVFGDTRTAVRRSARC